MLSDTACRNAHKSDKAKQGKAFKLSDEKGLYLYVTQSNTSEKWSKYWRLKYRIEGKEKVLAFGVYPEVTLEQARKKRDEARKLIAEGVDPSTHKKAIEEAKLKELASSLSNIAEDWLVNKCEDNDPDRPKRQLSYVLPTLGHLNINDIKAKALLDCIKKVQIKSGIPTAKKTLQMFSQIWRYAVVNGYVERDITTDLRGALPKDSNERHFAAIVEPKQTVELMTAIYAYQGSLIVSSALKLSALLFQRPGEIRAMKWEDVNLETKEWRYLVTKTKTQHIVPLAKQAVEIFQELHPKTGDGVWVFPGGRNVNNTLAGRCMSENAITAALAKLGYREMMTAHGFRAMARTILDEVLKFRVDIIEHQLAHAVKDPNGRAYNRTSFLPDRHHMMQVWADYLEGLRTGNNVVAFDSAKMG